jgi:hypothetical protein
MTNKSLTIGLIVVALLALAGVFLPQVKGVKAGAVSPSDISATNFTEVTASNGMQIGAGGLTVAAGGVTITSGGLTLGTGASTFSGLNFGSCNIRPYATTIAASSTAQVDCQAAAQFGSGPGTALAGITASDNIQANLGTSTQGTLFGGLRLRTQIGSSTPGWITLFVENDTGTTYTWSTSANASGTAQYIAAR